MNTSCYAAFHTWLCSFSVCTNCVFIFFKKNKKILEGKRFDRQQTLDLVQVFFICVTWLIHMCDMTHSFVLHDSFIVVIWLIHMRGMAYVCMCDTTHSYVWHDSFICVTWLIHMCDMTHSYVSHDACMCVTRLIHMRDITHSYVRHDSFIFVTRLIQMCDNTISCLWHNRFIRATHIHVDRCDMMHSHVTISVTFDWVMLHI